MKAKLLAALLLLATPTQAAQYQWTWTGEEFTGGGTLTTDAPVVLDPGHPFGTFEIVTNITGHIGSLQIHQLSDGALLTTRPATNRLYAETSFLLDLGGIGFITDHPDHLHPNPIGPSVYAASIHNCEQSIINWVVVGPPCFTLEGHEISTSPHRYYDLGSFSVAPVPGPLLGSGLPALMMLLAWWLKSRRQ